MKPTIKKWTAVAKRQLLKPLSWLLRIMNTYSNVVMAMAAVASVFLTYGLVSFSLSSLEEAKLLNNLQLKLSKLQHRQFILENTPVIEILSGKSKIEVRDGKFYVKWVAKNTGGGHAINIRSKVVVLGTESLDLELNDFDIAFGGSYFHEILSDDIGLEMVKPTAIPQKVEGLDKIKDEGRLYLLCRVNYIIPEEFTIDSMEKSKEITGVYKWSIGLKKFAFVSEEIRNHVIEKAKEYGYLKSEKQ